MLIYCDTSTLLNNIKRHDEPKTQKELRALEQLLALRRAGKIHMVRSRVALRELERTCKTEQRMKLRADYEALDQIARDENVHGFHSQFDQRGGGTYPLVSDVQDERLWAKLVTHGLSERDAQHITQAICNRCDVFLTRDWETIVKPHRHWLEQESALKIRLPSELAFEVG
jgi:hypothetical protein